MDNEYDIYAKNGIIKVILVICTFYRKRIIICLTWGVPFLFVKLSFCIFLSYFLRLFASN